MGKIDRWSTKYLIYFIKAYQYLISPIIGRHCRFYPTCSSYTIDAMTLHGNIRGIILSFKRLLRCHPWHPGGFDPVPKREKKC